ncbi:MAG: ActD [Fibrobacteria bacterium]|nr:ActD [Fibrobacteria bacterium]
MPEISDLKLERYALGELPAAERHAIEALLKTDPALRERLNALEASNAAILRKTPPEIFAARLASRQRREAAESAMRARPDSSSALGFAAWKPLLGGLALLAVLAVPVSRTGLLGPRPGLGVSETEIRGVPASSLPEPPASTPATRGSPAAPSAPPGSPEPAPPAADPSGVAATTPAPDEGGVRLKGLEPHLAIFRKTPAGSEPLHPGQKTRPGEVLRIGYQSAGFPYGAILSVDGNGNVTRHWPASGERAARLEGGEALLPSSFELDAAPDYERFYFVVSKKPFALDPLLRSLHEHESLPEPGKALAGKEIRIVRFELLKETGI